MQAYKFRNCLLNTVERSVIKGRQYVELTTRTFDLLQYLLEHAGNVVTKDEILGHVWNGSFVEESNLPVHISKLRKLLGENKSERYIETVQGVGYRFVAPVHQAGEDEWQEKCSETGSRVTTEFSNARSTSNSIAVLPLHNETGDPNNEYLTDGLTEGLINGLSHVPGLRVIARNTVFRYKNKDVDVKELGETLGVSKVLTGRVRVVDQNVIVGVELTTTNDATQIWGQHYDRNFSDIITLQEEIPFTVAEKLELPNAGKRKIFLDSLTRDAESYRFYLKGKFFLEKRSEDDLYKAIDFFNESVLLDPDNIHSYVEIIDAYRLLHLLDFISYKDFWLRSNPVLAAMAGKVQTLDVVQVMHCDLRMLEWNFLEAARHCRHALVINPNSLKGRLRYSDLLLQSRNVSGALEQLEIIMTIDPLSPLTYIRTGRLFYIANRYNDAIAYLNEALELEPGNFEALALRGAVYTQTGHYDQALEDFEASLQAEAQPETLAMIGVVSAKQGNTRKAYKVARQVEAEPYNRSENATKLAHIHLALGDKNQAYRFLERAYDQHEADLRALPYDPRWELVRNETRFRALVQKVGLPS